MKYKLYTRVLDGGEAVVRIIIDAKQELSSSGLTSDLCTVTCKRYYQGKLLDEATRLVTNVYTSRTQTGQPEKTGRYLNLTLHTNKDTQGASLIYYDPELQLSRLVDVYYTIKLTHPLTCLDGSMIEADTEMEYDGMIRHHVDRFEKYESSQGLLYREFSPEFDGNKKPLIVWLHGMGESGKDNQIQISANRGAVAFVTREAQALFGGAYVVAPQCPTFWMPIDYQGKHYHDDYTQAVLSLIDEVCVFHPDIDEDRIYIGGCSMGGYQTLRTVLRSPQRFAAAFPICAAYEYSMKEAWEVRNVPMWFVHCLADTTVLPDLSIHNYDRLQRLDSEAELTLYPEVRSQGEHYYPHAAWIPALRDQPKNASGEHLFEWLASKRRKQPHESNPKWPWLVAAGTAALVVGIAAYRYMRKRK